MRYGTQAALEPPCWQTLATATRTPSFHFFNMMMLFPTITPTICPICEEDIKPDDKRWYSLEAMGEVHFDCRDGDLPLVIDEKSLKEADWRERTEIAARCPHCRKESDYYDEDEEHYALGEIATKIREGIWQCDRCKQFFSSKS